MKNSGQHRRWILSARPRSVVAALASAIALSVLAIAPSARAQTYDVLYSFLGPPADGQWPAAKLVLGKTGNLYGTTQAGGRSGSLGQGTVFELDTSGKESILHRFTGTAGDGAVPSEQIVRYQGNTYGVTSYGGGTGCNSKGCGTVYELSRGKVTILHSFAEQEGTFPVGGLSVDGSGTFYGTTANGGSGTAPCGAKGCGTIFRINQGVETILYSFGAFPKDGITPEGELLLDRSGNLFGTTSGGGTAAFGTVFELSSNSDGTWTEHILYNFRGRTDGASPEGGLVMDSSGNLYGTTPAGGSGEEGVVFRLKHNPDSTWTERVLYAFGGPDGKEPAGSLVRDRQGVLYGVTSEGGAFGFGTVFKVDGAGQETILHSFSGYPDGQDPGATLAMDASGNLYGTTVFQGTAAAAAGTVFRIVW
jgi:uncharacterized repeat protein (TIGR03803 family)